jgi:hypothetical protein
VIWDVRSGSLLDEWLGRQRVVLNLAFMPDGKAQGEIRMSSNASHGSNHLLIKVEYKDRDDVVPSDSQLKTQMIVIAS